MFRRCPRRVPPRLSRSPPPATRPTTKTSPSCARDVRDRLFADPIGKVPARIPNSQHADRFALQPVEDSVVAEDHLAQISIFEFGDRAPGERMLGKQLYSLEQQGDPTPGNV